jgi:spore germination cell wall hydrolase CwlJ-like protein
VQQVERVISNQGEEASPRALGWAWVLLLAWAACLCLAPTASAQAATPAADAPGHQRRLDLFAARLDQYRAQQHRYRQLTAPQPKRMSLRGSAIRPGTSDLECLTQAIYYEARGEPRAGQVAVAQVVLNRTRQVGRPNTICQVVFQGAPRPGCQFSFACEGDRQAGPVQPVLWQQSQSVAQAVLAGQERGDLTATHYHADYVQPVWARQMQRLGQIGRHIFFGANS